MLTEEVQVLRHETEVTTEIAHRYRVQLNAMNTLHNAVMGMLTAGSWTIGRAGLDPLVINTMMGLLAKACKTFRSVHILCQRGLHEDASVLVRTLMETTVAALFILQKKPRERARIYQAYGFAQGIKMLSEWKRTPGLKRLAKKRMIKELSDAFAKSQVGLPLGTDVKHHWSGKQNLQEAVRALRADVMYRPCTATRRQ